MNWRNMDWNKWLKGLLSAIIGGASVGITVGIVDPASFNFQDGWMNLVKVCAVSAILAAGNYLKQAPLPKEKPAIREKA